MQRSLALSVLVFLAFAGAAAASDYMLPLLLEPEASGGSPFVPPPQGPPQQPQSGVVSGVNTGMAVAVAAIGALLVTGGTLLALKRVRAD
jgi:hypothetical protein